MTRAQGLFPNRDNIIAIICWVMDKNNATIPVSILSNPPGLIHSQFILLIKLHMFGHIYLEAEVATAVKSSIFAIDKNRGFIVNGTEVQENLLVFPIRRNFKRC